MAPTRHAASRLSMIALLVYAALLYLFLYGPIAMIGFLSFNRSTIIGFPFRGFTLDWYVKVVHTPQFLAALSHSIGVGLLAGSIATLLALGLTLAFRRDFPLKSLLFNLVILPIVMPGIVGGIVLLMFFAYFNVGFSLWTSVLVAHVNWVLPFAFLTLYPRVHAFDRSLEEAAMDLGARRFEVFRYVILPIIRPALIATFLFSFSLSFDEFIRTLFVTGYERTIPVMFWTMVVDELAPQLPAMAVIIILISTVTSLVGALAITRAGRAGSSEHAVESVKP
jgi:spermidine/putrescine transport system permease protein